MCGLLKRENPPANGMTDGFLGAGRPAQRPAVSFAAINARETAPFSVRYPVLRRVDGIPDRELGLLPSGTPALCHRFGADCEGRTRLGGLEGR